MTNLSTKARFFKFLSHISLAKSMAFCELRSVGFLPPHLILLSASSFYRLQIGVAHSWAGHLLTAFVRPEIGASDRDRGHDKYRFLPWDPTKLRLSPEAKGTTHEQTGKRTNDGGKTALAFCYRCQSGGTRFRPFYTVYFQYSIIFAFSPGWTSI